jgi:hypothetical protein
MSYYLPTVVQCTLPSEYMYMYIKRSLQLGSFFYTRSLGYDFTDVDYMQIPWVPVLKERIYQALVTNIPRQTLATIRISTSSRYQHS